MIKVARKPSPDPVQEKLRQNKANWNKEVSSFINDLIHLKKTMNGWPSKFYQEKSKIILPIPADPNSILDNLAGQFERLTQHGNAIVQEQMNYSKNRKLPRAQQATNTLNKLEEKYGPTSPQVPSPLDTPMTPDAASLTQKLSKAENHLVKIASKFESKYDLTAEASNPFTRFFAKLTNLPIGFGQAAEMRRLRMSMLNSCVKVFKNLEKLQVQIVRSGSESIDDAWAVFNDDVWKNWDTIRKAYAAYKGFLPKGLPDTGGPIDTPDELKKIKEKEDKESKALEKKMDQINQSEQSGKPGPDDPTFEPPPGEEGEIPSWEAGAKGIIDNSSKAMQLSYANKAKSDFLHYFKRLELTPSSLVVGDSMNELIPYTATPDGMKSVTPQLIRQHQQLVYDLNRMFNTNGRSLQEIFQEKEAKRIADMKMRDAEIARQQAEKLNKPPLVAPEQNKAVDQLEVTAQAFLKKWLGKTRHQLKLFDNTSSPRLNVYKICKEARKTVDMVMNHLEKDLKVDTMDPMIKTMNQQLDTIRGLMVNLHQLRTVEKKKHKAAK